MGRKKLAWVLSVAVLVSAVINCVSPVREKVNADNAIPIQIYVDEDLVNYYFEADPGEHVDLKTVFDGHVTFGWYLHAYGIHQAYYFRYNEPPYENPYLSGLTIVYRCYPDLFETQDTLSVSVNGETLTEVSSTSSSKQYSNIANNDNIAAYPEISTVVTIYRDNNNCYINISYGTLREYYDMYRLYNPNSGEHFYTSNPAERDNLTGLGWRYEGVGWQAPSWSNTPVYRLYNRYGGEHHYTTSVAERESLIAAGWDDEDIGWYSDDAQAVPVYRQYNPNEFANNHNYTTSLEENDHLVSLGWRAEDIGWYGISIG